MAGLRATASCQGPEHGIRSNADSSFAWMRNGGHVTTRRLAIVFASVWAAWCGGAVAGETHVAVAANFTEAAKAIGSAFKEKTGHDAVLSFGSTGQLYTQITQAAPFDILLSADDVRPKKAVDDGLGVPDSRFTNAIGSLVLWSKTPGYVKGEETLKGTRSRSSRSPTRQRLLTAQLRSRLSRRSNFMSS